MQPKLALIAGGASIVTVVVLIGLKLFAYFENGSASVLASLIDSVVDGSVSLVSFCAIRLSLKPPDAEHRHGHGKVEGLAALFQAAFIGGAGVFLLMESLSRFNQPPQAFGEERIVAITMIVSIVISILLIGFQNLILKKAPSLTVEADRAHYSMDILINLGVIGVMLAMNKGLPRWIDPLFAVAVSLYLGLTVKSITAKGIDMLLDRELPGDVRETITKKVLSHRQVMGMHDLRTTKSGMRVFISFDVELDPSLLLYHAHEIVREIEHDVLVLFPLAEILIHADPYGDTFDTRHHAAAH